MAKIPEQCIVTMLHYDMVGSTLRIPGDDPEEAHNMLRRWRAPAEAAIERAGGFVVDPEGDGGLAVFGWPVAHEDHADRACAAAWDVQHQAETGVPRPSGEPIQFRVGVHSGLVFFSREGGRWRAAGMPVHLATGLQKVAAPGSVLISSKTLGLCRSKLVIVPQPRPAVLDALDVDVLRLEERPRGLTESEFARRYASPIIGRGEQLHILRRALPSAGDPGAVAVIGDPGIGKSRLAAALMEEAQLAGVQTYAFFGDGRETTTPFAAARALILQALNARAPLEQNPLTTLASASLSGETIDKITPVLTGRSKRGRRGDATQTPTALARALASTLRTLTHAKPAIVLVEDLHLLDAESREFLRLLASENEPPLSLVLTGRPEALADAQGIARTVIRLPALPEADMAALAERLWRGEPLAAEIMQELLRRADGLPFVLEQIISSLDPQQLPAFNRLPLGVESLIHARVNRLSPPLRKIIQALGVLGEETAIDLAVETAGFDEDRFREGVRELEALAFLHTGTSQSIRFRHALLAEACRTMLTRRQSETLHRTALKAIARRYPDDPTQFGRLAHHAANAGDDMLALDYYWQAGRYARRQSARQSMKLIFEQAVQTTARIGPGADDKFADFVLLAFESMHQIGDFQRMMPLLARTIDMTRAAGQREKVCTALSHLAMAHWLNAHYAGGIVYAEEALDIAKELDYLPLRYYAQHNLASLLHTTGHVDRAVGLMSELCATFDGPNRAMRLGGVEIPGALSRGFLAEFLVDIGRYREAVESGREALEIAQGEREPFSEVMARIGLGEAYYHNGDFELAVDCLLPAKHQLDHYGLYASDPTVCGHLGVALSHCGRGEEALEFTQKVFDLDRISTPRAMHALWAGHTEARWAALGPAAAIETANSAIEFARERGAAGSLVQALGRRIRIRSALDANDPLIANDREEQAALCAGFGLVAWAPGVASR